MKKCSAQEAGKCEVNTDSLGQYKEIKLMTYGKARMQPGMVTARTAIKADKLTDSEWTVTIERVTDFNDRQ